LYNQLNPINYACENGLHASSIKLSNLLPAN
jgi:hypothetical protein